MHANVTHRGRPQGAPPAPARGTDGWVWAHPDVDDTVRRGTTFSREVGFDFAANGAAQKGKASVEIARPPTGLRVSIEIAEPAAPTTDSLTFEINPKGHRTQFVATRKVAGRDNGALATSALKAALPE